MNEERNKRALLKANLSMALEYIVRNFQYPGPFLRVGVLIDLRASSPYATFTGVALAGQNDSNSSVKIGALWTSFFGSFGWSYGDFGLEGRWWFQNHPVQPTLSA